MKTAPAPRPVTEAEVTRARAELGQLEAALADGPTQRARYATAKETLGDLEARYAEQQRAETVHGITGDLDAAEAKLTASRDRLGAAAADHMTALAALLEAAEAHNANVAGARALLTGHGLEARHGAREGAIGSVFDRTDGARIGDTDFPPVVAEAVTAHAVRLIFDHAYGRTSPLATVLAHHYYPQQLDARPDGLVLPGVPQSFTVQAPPPPVLPVPANML